MLVRGSPHFLRGTSAGVRELIPQNKSINGAPRPAPPPVDLWDQSVVEALVRPRGYRSYLCSSVRFSRLSAFLAAIHTYGRMTPMKKTATLNMAALNRVNIFKECFLGAARASSRCVI